jgi:hypothetical protein
MGFLDKVKAASQEATQKVKDSASDVQTKREIGQTFDELGKKAYELSESGAISHPEIAAFATKINDLKVKLEAEEADGDDSASAPPASDAPAAPPEPPATPS